MVYPTQNSTSSTFMATTVWWSLIQSTPRRGQSTALKKKPPPPPHPAHDPAHHFSLRASRFKNFPGSCRRPGPTARDCIVSCEWVSSLSCRFGEWREDGHSVLVLDSWGVDWTGRTWREDGQSGLWWTHSTPQHSTGAGATWIHLREQT